MPAVYGYRCSCNTGMYCVEFWRVRATYGYILVGGLRGDEILIALRGLVFPSPLKLCTLLIKGRKMRIIMHMFSHFCKNFVCDAREELAPLM